MPLLLSEHLEVVTFEPDSQNYACLVKNAPNIKSFNAGLWHEKGRAKMHRHPKNAGAHWVEPGDEVDLVTIDSLSLSPDLIWLDVEGCELKVLQGALNTLKTCRYVIIEEAGKKMEARFGDNPGDARRLLQSLGFVEIYKDRLDALFERLPVLGDGQ